MDRLGELISKARTLTKMTLRQLEVRTGISNGHLSQLERQARTGLSLERAFYLCRALRIDFKLFISAYMERVRQKGGLDPNRR
jgi:transcriptional regulator with XRE-family HTH domain